MCTLSYTSYNGCGCARRHATLPCPWAFYPELAKCDPRRYVLAKEVEGDCPECKPAFDNKSGLKPRITLNLNSPRRQRRIMQEVYPNQLQGTLGQIDKEHNQFNPLDAEERQDQKTQLFLDWLDDPEHPGPQSPASISVSSLPKPKNTPLGYRPMSSKIRQMILDRRDRRSRRQRGKITPSPIPTPPATMVQTFSVSIKDWYTLKARHYILSADQREALRRSGRHNIRRLSIISRSPKRSSDLGDSSSGEYISKTRHINLSASQRAALARLGRGNVRRLSIVGPGRRQSSSSLGSL